MEKQTYTKEQLAALAARDNNSKRPWLLVNPLQGKHIPCSPKKTLALFSALAQKLYSVFPQERLLIIGFAETATAIGAGLAAFSPNKDTLYIPTTREQFSEENCLYFSESHSHATEQKLLKNGLFHLMEKADRIVFAEDEVTTGNTILAAVQAIEKEAAQRGQDLHKLKYGVVSILNGMSQENRETFKKRNIPCVYLVPLNSENYESHLAECILNREACHDFSFQTNPLEAGQSGAPCIPEAIPIKGYINARLGTEIEEFLSACRFMTENILQTLDQNAFAGQKILVLGTEEFMFPPLYLAAYLEERWDCSSVRFHATTRSPILPGSSLGYPISQRYKLLSVYDPNRITFIYNLAQYDRVILVHDSQKDFAPGVNSLAAALQSYGCQQLSVYKWGD